MHLGRHPQRNIVLTGFHAAGKSAVGLELSRRMRRPFIDVGAELRRRRSRMRVLSIGALDEQDAQRSLLTDLSYRQETIFELPVDIASVYTELRDFSFSVFIDPPIEATFARLAADRRYRELLDDYGEEALLHKLNALRPRLLDCDLHLVGDYPPQRAAALVIHGFYT